MSEREIDGEVESFRRAVAAIPPKLKPKESLDSNGDTAVTLQQQHQLDRNSGVDGRRGHDNKEYQNSRSLCALLTTDAPLRAVNKDRIPLSPTILVNFDVPVRREDYGRRVATVLGGRGRATGQRLCINFVEAGKVSELRQLEVFAEREVREMPVYVADVFHC